MGEVNLLFLSYNNYFNRIIRREKDIADYMTYKCHLVQKVSFNPNDGVDASIIVNWSKNFFPDYCIVLSEQNTIISKWFITDFVRTRAGQYNAVLKRDVISDHYEEVINSPCFVEKGFVSNQNPLIFNKEDFACNQIKKQECLLRDASLCSWIVLYYNLSEKSTKLKGRVTTIEEPYLEIGSTLEEWDIYDRYNENGYKNISYKQFETIVSYFTYVGISALNPNNYFKERIFFDKDVSNINATNEQVSNLNMASLRYKMSVFVGTNENDTREAVKSCINSNKANIKSAFNDYMQEEDTFSNFIKWNGKIIKTTDNKFYRISILSEGQQTYNETLSSGDLFNALSNAFKTGGVLKENWSGDFSNTFYTSVVYDKYIINFEPITNTVHTYDFDFTGCQDVQDAPYGILALPYKTLDPRGNEAGYALDPMRWDISVLIARELCKSGVGMSSVIYDCQIVPYCPLDLHTTVYADGTMSFNILTDLKASEYTFIKDENNKNSCIALHPARATFTKNINTRTIVDITAGMHFAVTDGKDDYKVENQCTFYRLVSPNYNGQYEFNRAKNGDFSNINVDCTYKPYQPYIHLNPNFGGLYGRDFNDARGLICGGDFSFSIVSSAWETYKLQNKNYNEIFNRQIENLDTNYSIDQKYRQINAGIGVVGSGIVGAGGLALGHPAAAVGGAGGILGSAASGISGFYQAKEKHAEARDNAIDQHNFQLENVRALPDSLSKVDAFNDNNKLFPFLERYSCTDEEIEIFKNKLEFEGMTINAVGKIADYINLLSSKTFIKGKMLRMEGIEDDSHVLYAIYEEIAKGVYLSYEE